MKANQLNEDQKAIDIIKSICVGCKDSNRKALLDFEGVSKTLPQIEIPVKHVIHGGMYAREIIIPKGTIITGQIYKFDHLDIMIGGDVTVSTDTGEIKRLKGYNCLEGLSGKKRAGYTHKDTTWITVHPYDFSEDGEEIQRFITANSFEELESFEAEVNKLDYLQVLNDIGLTEEEVRSVAEDESDQVAMPLGYESILVGESLINDKGLFSSLFLGKGSNICPARIKGKRTPAGRYTNHAMSPNAKMVINLEGNIDLVAIKEIQPNEEITINYRHVINHRHAKGDLCQE